ncbi:ABC transporter domain containing protein [Trichostrongylus colubriformis]|uniref:ABC transporter domain containing protein n=1 Tax=Trichostrongylus colubriformis TaxID=6319 RepID=A0AAN8ITS6_TRICO
MEKGTTMDLSSNEESSPNEESAINTSSYEQTSSGLSTSSGSFRMSGAGEPQPTPSNLNDTSGFLEQLWLLTQKNFILTRRNTLWTFFELVVPIIIALPLTIYSVEDEPKKGLQSFRESSLFDVGFYLDGRDLYRLGEAVTSCSNHETHIAYFARENQGSVDNFINKLSKRLTSSKFSVKWVRMEGEDQILQHLRKDAENYTFSSCFSKLDLINQQLYVSFRFMGGVVFRKFVTNPANLDYVILIPTYLSLGGDDLWRFDQEWYDPFEGRVGKPIKPKQPPYLDAGFLPLQLEIDFLFIETSTPNATIRFEKFALLQIPDPMGRLTAASAFLYHSPHVWMLCAFVLVIYTAREISSERSTVKDFLSVMGLSTLVFYISHVLYGSLKVLLVFFVCTFPLIFELGTVRLSVFFVTFILYGVSAVVFAALISSLFKKPNNVIRAVILLWLILVAAVEVAPSTNRILYCTLSSLNPNAALFYALRAIAGYIVQDRALSLFDVFEDSSFHFTIGLALVMLLVDIIWMSVATLIFDFMFSDSDFTFFKVPFAKKFMSPPAADVVQSDDNFETDEGLRRTRAGISVEFLVKVWSTGERAVDGMSLKAYVGQVTVLLGHNGAGKSTAFSVICGITAPTAGNVYIYDLDIQKQRSACRKRIGLCPQGNALFDRLTVDEHLWLIHGLKGGSGFYKAEGRQLLDKLKLDEKSDELAVNLSGGQKRKLCVSMALIGGSTLILLDEPTAGMDPQARRDVEALLETVKVDRTVLLTTHYMDEAESLGDRVAIMALGRVYCCGTPQFLKERFGGGYIMTFVAAEKAKVGEVAETLAGIVEKYVHGAKRGPVHGKQFEITLPKEREKDFPQLFEHLEKSKDTLQISSFGLSLGTMEQVFLKVAEIADPAASIHDLNERINRHKELIQALNMDRLEGSTLIFAQLCALFTKRIAYYIRNWSQLIVQVLIPVGVALLCVYVSRGGLIKRFAEERTFSLERFGPSRIPVQMEANTPLVDAYLELVSEAPPGSLVHKHVANDTSLEWVKYLPKIMPRPGFGAVLTPNTTLLWFNVRAFHSMPTSVNVFDNALLRAETGGTPNEYFSQS